MHVHFNEREREREKKAKEKWPMNKGRRNFHNFGGIDFQISKNSTFLKGENNGNRVARSNNSRGGNIRGRGGRRVVGKSNVQCYNCQKLDHFESECIANKKEAQEDEARVSRQVFDDENTLLVMITEEENSSIKV